MGARTLVAGSAAASRGLSKLVLAAGLLVAGCGDDGRSPTAPPLGSIQGIWLGGTLSLAPHAGMVADTTYGPLELLLDLQSTSGAVSGKLVVNGPALSGSFNSDVQGTVTRTGVSLEATPSGALHLDLARAPDSRLSGSIRGTVMGATILAAVGLDSIPTRATQAEMFLSLSNTHVYGMVFDADTLWLSGMEDYLLATQTSGVVDHVIVYYAPGLRWISDLLARGGGRLWGHIPSAFTNAPTVSRVMPFRRDGLLPGDFLLDHVSSGLAHDGTHLWSLDGRRRVFQRVTEAGMVVDSVHVLHPQLRELDWDGTSFWSCDWYLPLLWNFSRNGSAVAAYRLPTELAILRQPAGLEFRDGFVYCAREGASTTRVAKLVPLPTPLP